MRYVSVMFLSLAAYVQCWAAFVGIVIHFKLIVLQKIKAKTEYMGNKM